MAITCCATPNIGATPHLLSIGAQASNHPKITNASNVLAMSHKSWSPINTITMYQSPRNLHTAYIEKAFHSRRVNHATRLSCFKIKSGHSKLNNMHYQGHQESDKSRSQVIVKCEMEPKGQEPTSAHDEQQQYGMCGEKKHTKKDHSGGNETHSKSSNKKTNAHSDPKPGNEWHDVFHGELREWKQGTRGPVRDEDGEEDPCNEYASRHGGYEDENQARSSLNATYKGQKTSLFPTTSYGPNFYAPVGTVILHYHFDNPSQYYP